MILRVYDLWLQGCKLVLTILLCYLFTSASMKGVNKIQAINDIFFPLNFLRLMVKINLTINRNQIDLKFIINSLIYFKNAKIFDLL